jgi:DNA-binding Lrp family transcriptional regulator
MANLKYNLTSLQEKAKERTVKTQSIEYDLETLVKKIDKNVIKLDPDYQRRHRWDDKTSSRLIESLILNIPIPTIYISQDVDVDSETEEYRYSVIDGQQRLTSIHNFLKDKYALIGLDTLEELNGCYHKDLPPFLIRRLEERTVKCLRIDSTLDAQVKIDIFERLNSGSVKLEPQELRNAVFGGKFNVLCKSLSTNNDFRMLLQIDSDMPETSNRVRKMEDVEIVLRFFALVDENYLNYKKTKEKGFTDFLSETMGALNNNSDEEIANSRHHFELTLKTILRDFGPTAFAKYKHENELFKLQSKFNVAVFDALAISVHDLIFQEGIKDFQHKKNIFKNLFSNSEFYESISGSYLDTNKLKYRIEQTKEALR